MPARKPGAGVKLNISSPAEDQMAKFVRGLTPWLVWLGGIPLACAAFRITAVTMHRPGLIAGFLALGTAVVTVVAWHTSHAKGWGRIHHALNALIPLAIVAEVTYQGPGAWHGILAISYAVLGLTGCLVWNLRYARHGDGVEDVLTAKKVKARKKVDLAYVVRVFAGRAPVIRHAGEKAGKVVPVLASPWRETPHAVAGEPQLAIEGKVMDADHVTPEAGAAADRMWRAIAKNFRDLAAHKIPDLNGAKIRAIDVKPWRIRTEVVLLRGLQTPKVIIDVREQIASQNALPLASIIATPSRKRHDRVFLDFVLEDTLSVVRWWAGPTAIGQSIAAAPTRFGLYEDRVYAERFGPAITTDLAKKTGRDEKNLSHLLAEGMNGSGKALALDTPVPTPSGWTTMGEIRVGDVVFDETGSPCRVTDAWDVRHGRPCYELAFSDGSVVVADADHQWLAHSFRSRIADSNQRAKEKRRGGPLVGTRTGYPRYTWPEVVTTEQIATALRVRDGKYLNWSIQTAGALECPEADLPIGPYTLGAWLGDGTTSGGTITTMDPEIVAEIEAEGNRTYVTPCTAGRNAPLYRIEGLTKSLRLAGLKGNKHIPIAYLRSSERQRRALLAGLLDTDGYCTKSGSAEFSVTSERLARDTYLLVCSLGYKATMRSKPVRFRGKDCGTAWTVSFTPPDKVFRLTRKLSRQVASVRASAIHRFITAVTAVDSVPVRCIAVDSPSHLFLVGEACIPTHNSSSFRVLVTDGATRIDVEDWLIDTVKKLQTFGQLAQAFQWFATTVPEARKMVRFLADVVIPMRADFLGAAGFDNWEPGCGLPYLRVWVEEGGIVASELDKLDHVLNSARSAGVEINLSVQRAHHALVDTNVRAAFGDTMSFGCKSSDDVFAMPDELRDAGADPSQWANRQPGKNYYAASDLDPDRQMMPDRAFNVDPAECREIIAKHAPVRDAWIAEHCPEWARLLEGADKNGTWRERTTGAAVLEKIRSTEARKLAAAGDALPAEPYQPPVLAEDDEIVEGEIMPDDMEEPVTVEELGLDPETAAGVAEDADIDPAKPMPPYNPEDELSFPPRPGGDGRGDALAGMRSYLLDKGEGFEFAPRDVYDDLCPRIGRSAGWVRDKLLMLADEGLLDHDRAEGRYRVLGPRLRIAG